MSGLKCSNGVAEEEADAAVIAGLVSTAGPTQRGDVKHVHLPLPGRWVEAVGFPPPVGQDPTHWDHRSAAWELWEAAAGRKLTVSLSG